LAALLSRELFGVGLTLPEIPVTKRIRGLGLSDGLQLAYQLEEKFDYKNTYYHQAPRFDITQCHPTEQGLYDFVISSEVMEHIPPPVELGFENLCRMLRPGGVLILTVPYGIDNQLEHFPSLHQFALASPGGRTVLLNRRKDGTLETFENLVFHGGAGSTLEMREFSEETLRVMMRSAGFSSVEFVSDEMPEFGVKHAEPWSLPIIARKGELKENNPELAAAYHQIYHEFAELRKAHKIEIDTRTRWALGLENELAERTEWALKMNAELKEHKRQQAIWQRRSVLYRLKQILGRS
jgi:SAM-dependent methyltransferase